MAILSPYWCYTPAQAEFQPDCAVDNANCSIELTYAAFTVIAVSANIVDTIILNPSLNPCWISFEAINFNSNNNKAVALPLFWVKKSEGEM
jgi:hypothetical protein